MIRLQNVSKRYGDALVGDGLSLHVPPGELFARFGPNGAGETTTIKMLCGPDELYGLGDPRRRVGWRK